MEGKKLAGDYNLGSDAVICSVIDSQQEEEGGGRACERRTA